MAKYLSIDTEATGLEENTHLIQLAFIPVDTEKRIADKSMGVEWFVWCPSFEELKPTLNSWVIEHNEGLIRKAHAEGLKKEILREKVKEYMESPAVKAFFGNNRVPLLGKSLSALDIPLLTRYFTKNFYEAYYHHHTLDVTCVARSMVDSGLLPPGCESTTKLLKHFGIREHSNHTALSDAVDMADVYFRLLDILKTHAKKA